MSECARVCIGCKGVRVCVGGGHACEGELMYECMRVRVSSCSRV